MCKLVLTCVLRKIKCEKRTRKSEQLTLILSVKKSVPYFYLKSRISYWVMIISVCCLVFWPPEEWKYKLDRIRKWILKCWIWFLHPVVIQNYKTKIWTSANTIYFRILSRLSPFVQKKSTTAYHHWKTTYMCES